MWDPGGRGEGRLMYVYMYMYMCVTKTVHFVLNRLKTLGVCFFIDVLYIMQNTSGSGDVVWSRWSALVPKLGVWVVIG